MCKNEGKRRASSQSPSFSFLTDCSDGSDEDAFRGGQRFTRVRTYTSPSDADGCHHRRCHSPPPGTVGPRSFSTSKKAELTFGYVAVLNTDFSAGKEVVFFIPGIKARNCSAVVAEREFGRSGEQSSPMAVLSGCSFPSPGSMAQIELFVTKDAVATSVFLHKLTPNSGT